VSKKYDGEETPDKAFRLALLGLTDEQMAVALDISLATYYNWKNEKHANFKPDLLEALNEAKNHADARVYRAMYQRAIGFSVPEEKIFLNDGQIIRVDTVKNYPPDPAAQKAWLANRRGMSFNADLNHSITTEINNLDDETTEEIKKRIKKLVK
jgi:transcriptional regulator with XRE-family HTH domain